MEPVLDEFGYQHWCKPLTVNGGRPFYCLGILFNCGHSYSCWMHPKAVRHEKEHRADQITWMFFSIAASLAFGVWMLAQVGIIK